MDVVSAISGYVSKMVSAGDGASSTSSAKMKILLLDSETVRTTNPYLYGADEWIGHHSLYRYHPVCPVESRSIPHRPTGQPCEGEDAASEMPLLC